MIALLAAMALAAETPMAIRTRSFPGLDEEGLEIGCMVMSSGHMLFGPEGFGGYSAVHYDAEAGELLLLSDRMKLLSLPITMDEGGRITDFGTALSWPIRGARSLPRSKDTEALVPWEDGFLVSRERVHDIVRMEKGEYEYQLTEQVAQLAPLEPVENNGGYEGATRVREGLLLAVPETSAADGTAPIVLHNGQTARVAARLRVEPEFSVTEVMADEASGRLFVLERAYDRSRGPRARISVVSLSAVLGASPEDVLEGEELGRLTFLEGADNMEGMTLVTNGDGTDSLILVSDDNFSDLQRTVLMTLRLTANCPYAPSP